MKSKNILFFISGIFTAIALSAVFESLKQPANSPYTNSVISGLREGFPNARFQWIEDKEFLAALISHEEHSKLALFMTNFSRPVFLFESSDNSFSSKTTDDKVLTFSIDRDSGTLHTLAITKTTGMSKTTFLDRNLEGLFREKFKTYDGGIRRFISSELEWVELY